MRTLVEQRLQGCIAMGIADCCSQNDRRTEATGLRGCSQSECEENRGYRGRGSQNASARVHTVRMLVRIEATGMQGSHNASWNRGYDGTGSQNASRTEATECDSAEDTGLVRE